MIKEFYYDLETTGLDAEKSAIHQLAGMIVIDNEIKEKFDFRIKPFPNAIITQDAMDVCKVKEENILQYPEHTIQYKNIITMLSKYVDKYNKKDKLHTIGYNISRYDDVFFRNFFKMNGDEYYNSWFWYPCLDVATIAGEYLKPERPCLDDFKQSTVAKYLGVNIDESRLHEAGYDVELCFEIYKKVGMNKQYQPTKIEEDPTFWE